MSPAPFYYRETDGIRITVRPSYHADQSEPAAGRWVFAYAVRIENVNPVAARLLSRRWQIHDSAGRDTEIRGEGVVGEQPLIQPGGVHEYGSFCVLSSPAGHMEGEYHFVRTDGTTLDARIPRFVLDATAFPGAVP